MTVLRPDPLRSRFSSLRGLDEGGGTGRPTDDALRRIPTHLPRTGSPFLLVTGGFQGSKIPTGMTTGRKLLFVGVRSVTGPMGGVIEELGTPSVSESLQ